MRGEETADGLGADEPHRRRRGLDAGEHRMAHFHHADELPLRVERGGAGKSGHRHRLAQFDRAAVDEPRLDLGQLAAAVLLFRIRNADQRQLARSGRIARQRQRRRLARPIDAQQREPVVLVVGDAVGVAQPGSDDHLAAFGEFQVGDDVALRAHHQSVAVFHRPRQRGIGRAALGKWRERTRHRHHHRRDDRFHHLVVQHGEAAHLAIAQLGAHGKQLQALHAADEEIVVVQHAGFDPARGRFLLLLLEQRGERELGILDAEGFNLHLVMGRGPARAAGGVARMRHQLGRQADADAGGRVDHHVPTEFVLVHLGGGDQLCALGWRELAGDLGLVALLEILDCRQHRVAAGGLAGIVARPQQRGLDFQAFVRRNSREHVGRRFGFGGGRFRRGRLCGDGLRGGGRHRGGLYSGRLHSGRFGRDRFRFGGFGFGRLHCGRLGVGLLGHRDDAGRILRRRRNGAEAKHEHHQNRSPTHRFTPP